METNIWKIILNISRQKSDEERVYNSYQLEVNPDEYILDAIERVWAIFDRSLTFRHACHHSTCGACGMLVNGVEKLTCITLIRSVTYDGGTIKVEPLRNFPVLSDLVVDMSRFYQTMEETGFASVANIMEACLPFEKNEQKQESAKCERLVDCIECGLCISACPAGATSSNYHGPAVMAALQHAHYQKDDSRLLDMADSENDVWRCHSAFECSMVCPSFVDPAWRIMDLRRKVIGHNIGKIFSKKKEKMK
jgi:succinate dehydrogenase/fumarate reductase iron-sulfur protein